MKSEAQRSSGAGVPSAAACAQAAAWIARLHGEGRTAQVEAGFHRWLAASPEHRAAFEMANDIWTSAERWPKAVGRSTVLRSPLASFAARRPVPLALAATALLLVGIGLFFRDSGLATSVGEQRTVTLEDGTRVTMNTATRVHVRYERGVRRVILDRGEALFEVSKRPNWPFIVVAGSQQVRALGTEFLVRRDERELSVTLLEGKVTVSPTSPRLRSGALTPALPAADTQAVPSLPQQHDFALSPGERLTFTENGSAALDRPSLEKVVAWERGHLVFDHTPLGEAVREMNRYSDTEIRIESPQTAGAQVTGIFRTGESENFARAIADAYQLRLVSQAGTLVLTGIPGERSPETPMR